jgi:hypothetical protein
MATVRLGRTLDTPEFSESIEHPAIDKIPNHTIFSMLPLPRNIFFSAA